jgi:hypothetical protein
VRCFVVTAREDLEIARQVERCLGAAEAETGEAGDD